VNQSVSFAEGHPSVQHHKIFGDQVRLAEQQNLKELHGAPRGRMVLWDKKWTISRIEKSRVRILDGCRNQRM
jgi:hypothetical protein